MKYTVIWTPAAERELAAVWTATADREAVTRAAHRLDELLERDAADAGESRSGDRRMALELPLGVEFEVNALVRMARVVRVWEVRSRRRG